MFSFFSTMSPRKYGTYGTGILGLLLPICSHCVIFEIVNFFVLSRGWDNMKCKFLTSQVNRQMFSAENFYIIIKVLLTSFLSNCSMLIWLWHISFKAGWSCFCYVCSIIKTYFWLNCGGSRELQVFCCMSLRSKDLCCRETCMLQATLKFLS